MTEHMNFNEEVSDVCNEIYEMLIEKNRAYGNSAFDPIRVFSKADPYEQIKVRIDDKISRIMRGQALSEDVVKDLIGYLVLLRIAGRRSDQSLSQDVCMAARP